MKNKLIIGNWKMNMNQKDALHFFDTLNKEKPFVFDYIILPPSPLIIKISDYLKDKNLRKDFKLGIQNFYSEINGAFTGEVSISMFEKDTLDYAIVGHSERRLVFKEEDNLIAQKALFILKNSDLKIIFIFGETKEQREKDDLKVVMSNLLKELNDKITSIDLKRIVFAYEPIWSIGSGKTPTVKEIEEIFLIVKEVLNKKFDKKNVEELKMIYGGSVNNDNYKTFLSSEHIDGLLVGGVSLDSSKFISMLKNE